MQLSNPRLLKNTSFINGEFQPASQFFSVDNPADLSHFGDVGEVTSGQLTEVIESASLAMTEWQTQTVDQRSQTLLNWYQLIMDNQSDLAAIMTAEQGKSEKEAMAEIAYGAKYIDWYAAEGKRANGEVLPLNQAGRRAFVLKRPVGLVAAITPWNFPSAMILRKAAPALAAGCAFIVKPSELTPFSALALAELAQQAGIPTGIFNVVVGSDSQGIGEKLTGDARIAKFSFTGSTKVGKQLLTQCAPTVKKTAMELGGNAPFIVFEDANMQVAVKAALASKFRNAGQTCVCANRFIVHASRVEEFVQLMLSEMQSLKLSPLISQTAVNKVNGLVNQAITSGAQLLKGGESEVNGNYYPPTLLTNVTPAMEIFNQEIFGPVVAVSTFEDEAEVVALANQTEYGLCAYFMTQNMARIWRLSESLEFGMVGVNEGVLSNPAAPFGGVKASGMGREGGHWGLDDYLETRYLCIGDS